MKARVYWLDPKRVDREEPPPQPEDMREVSSPHLTFADPREDA